MKCPKCDLVTFDHLAQCPRCKASFARQRRLTRRGRRSDRPILIPRPGSGEASGVAAPEERASPPRATEERRPTTSPRTDSVRPEPAPRTAASSATPTADQHAADAATLKDRMMRAGQVRRARSQNVSAEVDPVLPDWYEPALDDDETEDAVVPTRSARR